VEQVELLICTNNLHKLEEIRSYIGPNYNLKSFRDLVDFEAPEETSLTFAGNALLKAQAGYKKTGLISIADDSGLEVVSLGGKPGVFSARYAGETFVSALALVGSQKIIVVMGTVNGAILEEPRGDHGFGYDPLFFLPEKGKTMAELSLEEKNQISHRGRALVKMAKELAQIKV
jgi:XTP/dITP diphosphohydrolase